MSGADACEAALIVMRVVHVIAGIWENTGGPAQTAPGQCSALRRAGCQVFLATLDGPLSEAAMQCRNDGVDLRTYATGWKHTIWYSPAISNGIRELANEADIVHGHGLWLYTDWVAAKWARRLTKPLVISPIGTLMPQALRMSSWKKRLAWALFDGRNVRSAACLHACSIAELQAIRKVGLTNPVAVIPNGVSLPDFRDPEIFLGKFPQVSGRRILLFLSRIHPSKGLLDLAEAWGAVAPDFPDWHLVITGPEEASYGAKVRAKVSGAGIESRTTMTGPLYGDERWAAYAASDLFVLPTRTENFGMAIAEALAAGVPVITTHGAPWPDLVERKCGWWVPVGPEPLIAALREAMSLTDEERRRMGERGRTLVTEKYSWSNVAKQMIEVYEWILGGGPPPSCVDVRQKSRG